MLMHPLVNSGWKQAIYQVDADHQPPIYDNSTFISICLFLINSIAHPNSLHPDSISHLHTKNDLHWSIHLLTQSSLRCRRKQNHPKETHTFTGRTCRILTESTYGQDWTWISGAVRWQPQGHPHLPSRLLQEESLSERFSSDIYLPIG